MALLGWATLAWQADYGQFYVIDREDASFRPPQEFTPETEARGLFVPPSGLVVYTNDCLQQQIHIHIHDAEPDHSPVEEMSGKPWTRLETVSVRFPSRTFSLSSPSAPDPLPYGPVFFVHTEMTTVRIGWMEFQEARDDSVPVEPDVIALTFWPG